MQKDKPIIITNQDCKACQELKEKAKNADEYIWKDIQLINDNELVDLVQKYNITALPIAIYKNQKCQIFLNQNKIQLQCKKI